jgi:Mce-associated membrane protein
MKAIDDAAECPAVDDADPHDPKPAASKATTTRWRISRVSLALIVCVLSAASVAGIGGWLAYQAYGLHRADERRQQFLETGRQAALNLTTINHADVDANVRRILDLATGTFHDDFSHQSAPFVEEVRREQSNTEGSITGAGLESVTEDSARIIVAVLVTTTTVSNPQPQQNRFRLRLDVRRVEGAMKVSDVQFIS